MCYRVDYMSSQERDGAGSKERKREIGTDARKKTE